MSIWQRIKQAVTGESEEEEAAEAAPSLRESYVARIESERIEKDFFFQRSTHSPLPLEEREGFEGLRYYEPDPDYQMTLPLQREEPEPLVFQTSTGGEQYYRRIGTVSFEVEGEPAKLAVYESAEHGELFLPFRDATSAKETYGAGRYLEPGELGAGQLLVDFNLAYNPYCAYSPDFSCPLPPMENWLKVPIRAGEKSYKAQEYVPEDVGGNGDHAHE